MQEFTSADSRHDFALDGAKYYLPAMSFRDFETLATFDDMERADQADAMRAFLVERAITVRPALLRWFTGQKSARRAIESMSIGQSSTLFKAWAGMDRAGSPGESSGSVDGQ